RTTAAYAVRSTNRRLARPLRSLCDGDHKNAHFVVASLRVTERRLQARLRGHRVETAGLALCLRPLAALGQEQESGGTSGQARSGGGLGAVSCWDSGRRLPGARDSGGDGGSVRIALSSSSVTAH